MVIAKGLRLRTGATVLIVALTAIVAQFVFREHRDRAKIRPDKGWYEYGPMKAKKGDSYGMPDGTPVQSKNVNVFDAALH